MSTQATMLGKRTFSMHAPPVMSHAFKRAAIRRETRWLDVIEAVEIRDDGGVLVYGRNMDQETEVVLRHKDKDDVPLVHQDLANLAVVIRGTRWGSPLKYVTVTDLDYGVDSTYWQNYIPDDFCLETVARTHVLRFGFTLTREMVLAARRASFNEIAGMVAALGSMTLVRRIFSTSLDRRVTPAQIRINEHNTYHRLQPRLTSLGPMRTVFLTHTRSCASGDGSIVVSDIALDFGASTGCVFASEKCCMHIHPNWLVDALAVHILRQIFEGMAAQDARPRQKYFEDTAAVFDLVMEYSLCNYRQEIWMAVATGPWRRDGDDEDLVQLGAVDMECSQEEHDDTVEPDTVS